jgi:hypothetical protein
VAGKRDPAESVHLDDDLKGDEEHDGHLDKHRMAMVHVLFK